MKALIGVVDDDASIRRALKRLLGAAGFVVTTYGSGEELLLSEDLHAIDCLVVDIQLTGSSGFVVQERLAQSHRPIPIVFITAHDEAATRESAQCLRKPFDEQALIQAITTALRDDRADPRY